VSLVIVPEDRIMPSLLWTNSSLDRIRWGGSDEGEEWEEGIAGTEGEIVAKDRSVKMCRAWDGRGCADQITSEGLVDFIHRPSKRM
jgi:hypothetical protein